MKPPKRFKGPRVNRRHFLGAGAATASGLAAQPAAKPLVLITSAAHAFAQALAASLQTGYRIRMTERTRVATAFDFVACPLANDPATRSLVRGVDVILHVAEPLPDDDDWRKIEYLTRGTYNLLSAAAGEQVSRLVYLSTLELMTPYDADFTVSESWQPRPAPASPVLSKHLGEFVCREFARDRKLRCVTLRLAKVVRHGETAGFDPLWVDERDAVHAAELALQFVLSSSGAAAADWWRVLHIAADSPRGRFSVAAAKRILGYQPKYAW